MDALARATQGGASAAAAYENFKRSFQETDSQCAQQGIAFVPMVAETSGAWGPQALKTFRTIAKIMAQREEGDEAVSLGLMLQQLCVIIRSGGARAVLRRLAQLSPDIDFPSEVLALPPVIFHD